MDPWFRPMWSSVGEEQVGRLPTSLYVKKIRNAASLPQKSELEGMIRPIRSDRTMLPPLLGLTSESAPIASVSQHPGGHGSPGRLKGEYIEVKAALGAGRAGSRFTPFH